MSLSISENAGSSKIQLLTPETFHGDEITAKSGETWLGLFEESNRYFLRPAKIRVRLVKDEVADEDGQTTAKRISVIGQQQPILLLKNAAMLKAGIVTTLFYNDPEESETAGKTFDRSLKNDYESSFKLRENTYTLKVTNKKSKNKELSAGSTVTLALNGKTQILYAPKQTGASWYLYWAGDLDGDGKLDLLMDLNDHYNVTHLRLFLSSEAQKQQLVKEVASLRTTGC